MQNVNFARREAFDVQLEYSGSQNLLAMCPTEVIFFQTLPRPKKKVFQLADPYQTLGWDLSVLADLVSVCYI